jgi:hypothetical protein
MLYVLSSFQRTGHDPERHQAPDAPRTPSGRLAPAKFDLGGRFLGNLSILLKPTALCQAPFVAPLPSFAASRQRRPAGRDVDSSSRVRRRRPPHSVFVRAVGSAFRVSDLGARNRACLGTNAESEISYYAPRVGLSTPLG